MNALHVLHAGRDAEIQDVPKTPLTFTTGSDGPLDLRQCAGPSNGTQHQHSGANSTHVLHLYSMQPFSSDSHDLGAHHPTQPSTPRPSTSNQQRRPPSLRYLDSLGFQKGPRWP
ncbi:hypothetical protein F5H01DRAFT_363486 [Linnemannia elongata]|nr:hypothetical protein F5H01DRAFT_363486 [Linnemannia elongata]